MYVSEAWAGDRPRRLVNLLVAGVYVGLLVVPYVDERRGAETTRWLLAAACVGVLLLVLAAYQFVTAPTRKAGLLEALPDVLIVLTPVPYLLGLPEEIGLLFVYAALLISIRDLARGHAIAFSLAAVLSILLVTSVALAEVEEEAGTGNIRNAGQALFWGLGQIFRFHRAVSTYSPESEEGNLIGSAVILSGVFFSAVLISAITAWAVNSGRKKTDSQRASESVEDAVVSVIDKVAHIVLGPEQAAEVRAAMSPPPEMGPPPGPGETRVWIDVERVVGERPFSWWQPRSVTVPAYVSDLRESEHVPRTVAGDGTTPLLVAVVEGSGCAEPEGETTTASGVRLVVVHAPGGVTDATAALILERAVDGDVVVTGRSPLADELREREIPVVSPDTLATSPA